MDNEGLILKIDGDDSGYEKALNNAKKKASEAADAAVKEAEKAQKEISAKMNKINSDASSVVQGINSAAKKTALGIAAAGTAVLGLGINYNAQMEQHTASFTTMLGSAEKAKETLADLKGFAETTPFELTDLANASTTLLAFEEDINDLMPDLKTLGDISLGNAEKFKGLALVFGQVKSQGRLMGQDLLQMINQGFNPLQIISEKTGKSMATLKEEMSEGKISFEMVADAMKTATSEGGQFYNAMENQSKTFTGQMSTLKDNVVSFFGEVSSSVSNTLTEDVLPKAISLTEDLKGAWADGTLQEGIKTAGSVTAALGTAIVGLNIALFVHDLSNLKKGVESYTAATKLGTAAQKAFNAAQLATPTGLLLVGLAAVTAGIVTYAVTHKDAANSIMADSNNIINSLKDLEKEHEDVIKSIDKKANAEIAEAEIVMSLKDDLYELENQYKDSNKTTEEATEIEKEFNIVASKLAEKIPDITSALYDENGAIDIQKGKVDTLTQSYVDLAIAKATASALEEKMKQTASDLFDAKKIQKEAVYNYGKISSEHAGRIAQITGAFENGQYAKGTLSAAYYGLGEAAKYVTGEAPYFLAEKWAEKAVEKSDEEVKKLDGELNILAESSVEVEKTLSALFEKIGKKSDKLADDLDEDNDDRTTSTKKLLQDQNKAIKEAYEEDYKNLKYRKEMGEIAEEEYYKELEKLGDEYFAETDEEWQELELEVKKHLDEIEEENRKTYEKMREDAVEEIEKLADKHKSIVDNLKADKHTYTFKFGDGESETYSGFVDMSSSTAELKEYEKLLIQLEEKLGGEIPDKIKNDLADLTADEAIAYIKPILNMSDEEFSRIAASHAENDSYANRIADILIDDEADEMVKGFIAKFGEIPEDFFVIGQDSGEQYGKGFMKKMQNVCTELRETIRKIVDDFQTDIQATFDRGNMIRGYAAGNTTTYADYRTTNIYAASSSPHDIAEATRQQSIYEKHTSRG